MKRKNAVITMIVGGTLIGMLTLNGWTAESEKSVKDYPMQNVESPTDHAPGKIDPAPSPEKRQWIRERDRDVESESPPFRPGERPRWGMRGNSPRGEQYSENQDIRRWGRRFEEAPRGPRGRGQFEEAPRGPRGRGQYGEAPRGPRGRGQYGEAPRGPRGRGQFEEAPRGPRGRGQYGEAPRGPRGRGQFEEAPRGPRGRGQYGEAPRGPRGRGQFEEAPRGPRGRGQFQGVPRGPRAYGQFERILRGAHDEDRFWGFRGGLEDRTSPDNGRPGFLRPFLSSVCERMEQLQKQIEILSRQIKQIEKLLENLNEK